MAKRYSKSTETRDELSTILQSESYVKMPVRHQLTHNQLMSPQGPHFIPHRTAKINDKSISDVVTASVYSEKTRLKKLMMMILNKS